VSKVVLIAGPTASGKSAAALALAEHLHGTIINADSMQVYRELVILTARPAEAEISRAPHRLYGIVGAEEAYSVGRWLEDAVRAIADAKREGRVPILVGGTGLYFKALIEGLAPVPDVPPEIRKAWRERAEKVGAEGLYRELEARDPVMAARLRPSDPQRLLRALEVIDATGVSLADPTPAGLTFVSATAPCAGGFPCALGTMAMGTGIALTATYDVPAAYTGPSSIVNTATVSAATADALANTRSGFPSPSKSPTERPEP